MASDKLILSSDYPFKLDLEEQAERMKYSNKAVVYERLTIIDSKPYLDTMFTKVFQNRTLLKQLSSAACKVLIHIIVDLDYLASVVILTAKDSQLAKNTFYKAIMELTTARIIRKMPEKKETYWVNLALLSNGNAHDKTK